MPCCKAEEFDNWCKDAPMSAYKDIFGDEYCLFHAPRRKKIIPTPEGIRKVYDDEFNKLIFEKIKKAKKTNEECNLSGAIFEGEISFRQFGIENPLPDISFEGATFTQGAYFSKAAFSERADFSEAIFKEGAKLFGRPIFNKEVVFKNLKIDEKLIMENFDLSNVSFMDTEVRKIDFIKCDWRKERFRKYILYNEYELFHIAKNEKESIEEEKDLSFDDKKEVKEEKISFFSWLKEDIKESWQPLKRYFWSYDRKEIEKVELLYRRLKEKYTAEKDNVLISEWHYGEKEMFRKKIRARRYLGLSLLYWASSGYGERPVRAGMVLLGFIISLSLLLAIAGLEPLNLPGRPDYGVEAIEGLSGLLNITLKQFKALVLNTLQYATFRREPIFVPVNITGGYLKFLSHILIPLQAALFGLAVRNRFRR